MKRILLLCSAALLAGRSLAWAKPAESAPAPADATAAAAPLAPQQPSQPLSPTAAAPAAPLAPSQPASLSPSAGLPAQGASAQPVSPGAVDTELPEEVGLDQGAAAQPVPADLSKLDSATLARLARSLGVDAPTVWFDPDQQQPLNTPAENAQSVDAGALFAALQQRSDGGDKDARQALAMARLRGDPRATLAPAGAAALDSGTAQALGLSPSAAAEAGLQALSAVAQALGLSPGAGVTRTATPSR